MTILEKLIMLLLVGIIIYIWNKYVVTTVIKKVPKKNPDNKRMADIQPIFIKCFQAFYWLGYLGLWIALFTENVIALF
ncbi:MAG: hypothetical protein ABJD23_15505 [Nonlabens sp.]